MAKKNKLKNVLIGGAVALALIMAGGSLARLSDDTKDLGVMAYSIGEIQELQLDGTGGKIDKKAKTSLYTSKLYNAEDLVAVKVAKDAKVKATVHYYDADGEVYVVGLVVNAGGELKVDSAPQEGTFRIEITPTEDEDGEIGIFEKADYVKAVTVTLLR